MYVLKYHEYYVSFIIANSMIKLSEKNGNYLNHKTVLTNSEICEHLKNSLSEAFIRLTYA